MAGGGIGMRRARAQLAVLDLRLLPDLGQRVVLGRGDAGFVEPGDWVILTKGDSYHGTGGTNTMKILHVGDPLV